MGNSVYKPIVNQQDESEERDESDLPSRQPTSPIGKIVTPNLKVFTFAELKSATKNFNADAKLGEDGFGRVFKGWINETTLAPSEFGVGMAVAVKKSSLDSAGAIKQWETEVNLLGKFSHPNIIRLIGYFAESNDHLLVYEYLPNGSLENQLFNRSVEPLSWGMRVRIAMDVARGLDFLHNNPDNTVIYRDVKPANILLDEKFGAKLSNFELATMGHQSNNGSPYVSTEVMGTYGYAAPEYIPTGHLYLKSDVYGFGVVLLEILTGLRSMDRTRPSSQHSIVDMFKPILHKRAKMKKKIDPRMGE